MDRYVPRDIISVPRHHVCWWLSQPIGAGWWHPSLEAGVRRWPNGTVRQCHECGATWIAGEISGLVPNVWRRESRLARWWRERRAR